MKKRYHLFWIILNIGVVIYIMNFYKTKIDRINSKRIDFHRMYLMSVQWLKNSRNGIDLAEWLYENGYREVAIYGLNEIGNILIDLLKDSKVKVAYGIDKKGYALNLDINVYRPNENLKKVDLIIVTAFNYFDEIQDEMNNNDVYNLIPIDMLIYQFKKY